MIGIAWWQGLLDGLGWFLAKVYDLVPNYGVAIILLTVGIRLLLLPLGLKQIRSMHAMQSIQPQLKQLQQKHKGNRQKLNEEMMKLYKERGVNPLAGCLPMLLQLPVLIALYSVLRFPQHPPHLPDGSELKLKVDNAIAQGSDNGVSFLGTNLLCSATQAGKLQVLEDKHDPKNPTKIHLDCGNGFPVRIPYYLFAVLMVGTTYYQQRQMMKANPGAQASQQQALMRIMPLLFGIWGFIFPAGLVVYWTTSNLIQIGQQHFFLRGGPQALPAPGSGGDGAAKRGAGAGAGAGARAGAQPARKGLFASMLERAETERARRQGSGSSSGVKPSSGGSGGKAGGSGGQSGGSNARSGGGASGRPSGSGGGNARSRKKRRKR